MKLGKGRSEGEPIKITYSYDTNGKMHCTFEDVKKKTKVALASNEGMALNSLIRKETLRKRSCDVIVTNIAFVGRIGELYRLGYEASDLGIEFCLASNGELGIASAANHHVLLSLPKIVKGNQQISSMLKDDILLKPLPIAEGPNWGIHLGPGIGVVIDEDKIYKYHNQSGKNSSIISLNNKFR